MTRRRLVQGARLVAMSLPVLLLVPATSSASSGGAGAVTLSKTVSRVHLVNGKNVVADKRHVIVHVSRTQDLHDRQEVEVSWSGAHPTSNGYPDPNAGAARQEEYPVVVMECRGVDSGKAPISQQVRPETCWTQSAPERYIFSPSLAFPPWRVDRYATKADRRQVAGAPKKLPDGCFASGYTERWVPFVAAGGTRYYGGPNACAGEAPEATDIDSSLSLPGNTTYGVTGSDGKGSAKFNVWNGLNNASLGCSPKVSCSLVVIPIEGISCDVAAKGLPSRDVPKGSNATAADAACRATGGHTLPDVSVTGALWWSASNWRNRISIPLSFAPLPTDCGLVDKGVGVDIYGSELMTPAAQQWGSHFCRTPGLFPVTHVQTGEPQARNLLTSGNVDAAYSTNVPDGGYTTPMVNAPVAFSGFAIGYTVDDADRHEVTDLRLTPRLLAKLLTESYPAISAIKESDPDLADNPLDMSSDPEFIALNPGIPEGVTAGQSAATLYSLSSDSDVMYALTAYINADPEARAWLDGKPDPWGMKVNANYKGIKLPVDSWPLLDTFEPTSIYDNGSNECLHDAPVPYLPLVAAPASRIATISLGLQFSLAPSQVVCQLVTGGGSQGEKLVALGRQTIGSRFLLGVTSLADADRYGIDTAALQTRVDSTASATFQNTRGRSFVRPDDASLRAAAKLLHGDDDLRAWTLPARKLTGASGSADAYPGAMLVNASVPTGGLPASEAHHYATFLRYAATDGQRNGATGDLPPGYLPLTHANGLGRQAGYTLAAATAVAAQAGETPALSARVATEPSAGDGGGSPAAQGGGGGIGGGTPHGVGAPGTGSEVPPSGGGTPSSSHSSDQPPGSDLAASTGPVLRTPSTRAGLAGGVVPLLGIISLVAILAGVYRPRSVRRGRAR